MVAFNEESGSPRITHTSTGAEAQRFGIVSWTDIDALIAEVFPPTVNAGITIEQGAGIAFPGKDFLRADSLDFVPHFGEVDPITGPDTTQDFDTLPTYATALATINYTTQRFSQGEGEQEEDPVSFLRHRWSIGGEFLTTSNDASWAEWDLDDGILADEPPSVFIPTIEHEITWPRVTSPPFATIRDRIGKVNSAAGNFVTGIVAAETLAFIGAEIQREILSDGSRAWEVTYRFSEKRVVSMDEDPTLTGNGPGVGGWNHFWRTYGAPSDVNVSGFYRVNIANAPTDALGIAFGKVYKLASFDELFQSG